MVKLKRDLKYSDHVYFESVFPHIIYQALIYLKSHIEFYEDISITKSLSSEDMLIFFVTNENQGETELHRIATNEITQISEIPNIID